MHVKPINEAHDIAEIAEKEYETQFEIAEGMIEKLSNKVMQLEKEIIDLKERFKADECDLCNDLQDENEELKQQLADIKYLNREEVEKIIYELSSRNSYGNNEIENCDYDNLVTAICNLATKPTCTYLGNDKIEYYKEDINNHNNSYLKDAHNYRIKEKEKIKPLKIGEQWIGDKQ